MAKASPAHKGAVTDPYIYFQRLKAEVTKNAATLNPALLKRRGITPGDIKFLKKFLAAVDADQFRRHWMTISGKNYDPGKLAELADSAKTITLKLFEIGTALDIPLEENSAFRIMGLFMEPDMVNVWLEKYNSQKDDFTFAQLSKSRAAFSHIGVDLGPEFLSEFISQQFDNPLPESVKLKVDFLMDFALIRRRPPEEFLNRLMTALTLQVDELRPNELRNSLSALGKLAIDPGSEFLDRYLAKLKDYSEKLTPESVFQILRAAACLHALTRHDSLAEIAGYMFDYADDFEKFFSKMQTPERRTINMAAQWFDRADKMMNGAGNSPLTTTENNLRHAFEKAGAVFVPEDSPLPCSVVELDDRADLIEDFNGESFYPNGLAVLENALYAALYPENIMIRVHPLDSFALNIEESADKLVAKLLPHFADAAPGVYETELVGDELKLTPVIRLEQPAFQL